MIKHINLEKSGLEMFLGPTETKIMLSLWKEPKTPSNLHRELIQSGETFANQTVGTVLTRLVKKGLLVIDAEHYYHPTMTKNAFIYEALKKLDHKLWQNFAKRVI